MRAPLSRGPARPALLPLLLLALAAAAPLAAQTDVIRGRVTNVDGQPLPGVQVTATSIPGSVTREARTNNQGNYQIVFPGGTGDYMMGFALLGYDFKQFELKRLADEEFLVADARLSVIELDALVVVAPARERVNRNQPIPDVGGTEQTVSSGALPADLQGDLAAMAASLPGVVLLPGLDGAPDAFSVLGLDGEQNSVTLNGMQSSASSLPRDASVATSLVTSPYDPSRGGFSGANLNVRAGSGSNVRVRGTSLVATAPQMQWTDAAARALGNEYSSLSLSGMASGPIRPGKLFYNLSYQLGRQARDNPTLLSTSALGLRTAGIATDSVSRFLGILQGRGIPTLAGPGRDTRLSDNGSVLAAIDFAPPNSTSGQSLKLTLNGNWRLQTPASVGPGPLSLESASGDRTSWGGSAQGQHTGYFGLVLSETALGLSVSRDGGEPYLELPAGRVRVSSTLDGGESGVQNLSFGGNQSFDAWSRTTGATFQNTLSWFDGANKHRIKLTTELQYNASVQERGANLLGTFVFNSLADLEAGRPASFSRTLTASRRDAAQWSASVAIGDSYRRTPDLQFQYGLRVDASRFTTPPELNPLVESTFGRRNDRLPAPLALSPRIGFSWTVGKAPEVGAFVGAAAAARAVVRGGVGVFANNLGVERIGAALDNTGLPGGVQEIVCVGPAAPVPSWAGYLDDPAAIPDRCADGSSGTLFSNAAPSVTLFGGGFSPQRSVRSNLSWSGGILDRRLSLFVEGTYSLNLNQQRSVDLNFDPTVRFTLDDGRPVFVQLGSIVPGTGSIASRDARVSQAFSRVTELRSDFRSRTAQLSVRLSPIPRGPARFGWSLGYTYSHIREQLSGFTSTDGNPLDVHWVTSAQGPHQVNYSLRYNFFDAVQVSWTGGFRSGSAFTPMIAGDVNGDGYANDRAFIPPPVGEDLVAAGMAGLLESGSSAARECLERQVGRIARRNSCRGPWTSNASLNVTLDRAKFRMPHRATVSFSVSNPLGAADLLVNGSDDLRGWGQSVSPDPNLLYVRGFDPQRQRYLYEVNERFGATSPRMLAFRTPVILSASVRIDLGPTRERQNLSTQLAFGRKQPGARLPLANLRQAGSSSVPNPMATILRSQDTLRLTAFQADSIAAMNRRYLYRADSLWTPVAAYLDQLPDDYDEEAAYRRYGEARQAQLDMLAEIGPAIRALLEPRQRRMLPPAVSNLLDPRYIASIRPGTGTYTGTSVGPAPLMIGSEVLLLEAPVMIAR